jgi:hypothetical protein
MFVQQFVLTGSSARKLRREGVNLLGGRATQKLMHSYMAVELGPRFKLGTALRQGMLPVVWAADDPIAVLEAYNALLSAGGGATGKLDSLGDQGHTLSQSAEGRGAS